MKYSSTYERDFNWYLSMRHIYKFAGRTEPYVDKKGRIIVVYDKHGKTAKECFYLFDSNGIIHPTKHPTTFNILLKTKISINLIIKEYAIDRASGLLPGIEFKQLCKDIHAPFWFSDAVERQKFKYMPYKFI